MYRSIAIFSASFLVAAAIAAAGAAQARTVVIGGFVNGTSSATQTSGGETGVTSGARSAGPGRFTVRDAKTGKVVATGKTATKSGVGDGLDGRTDVSTGTAELFPGTYTIEIWQTGTHNESYKSETTITVNSFVGTSSVILQLDLQTPSEVALDEAEAMDHEIDVLLDLLGRVQDRADRATNPTSCRIAEEVANIIHDRFLELRNQMRNKRAEVARLAEEEAAEKAEKQKAEKRKAANEQNTLNNTMRNARRGTAAVPRNYAEMPQTPHMAHRPRMSVRRVVAPLVETPRVSIRPIPTRR